MFFNFQWAFFSGEPAVRFQGPFFGKLKIAIILPRALVMRVFRENDGNLPLDEYTPPKTNMEPENGPLEKEIPIGNHHLQVPC